LPKRRIGQRALDLLCDLLEHPDDSAESVVLDVSLVERDSVTSI